MLRTLLRRLRGMAGVGLTWAIAYGLVFLTLGVVISLVDPDSIDPGEKIGLVSVFGTGVGFVSGCISALVLAAAERHKTLGDLSLWRMALWGALSAGVWPFVTPANDMMVVILAPLGAVCAVGTLAIARRGSVAELPAGDPADRLAAGG